MRSLLILSLLSFPFIASSNVYESTQIHDIDFGDLKDEHVLVLLTNGHVTKIPKWDARLLLEIRQAQTDKTFLDIDTDHQRFIRQLEKTDDPPISDFYNSYDNLHEEDYVPTVISSLNETRKIFRSARYHDKDSQCFNRAHIWTYEWWKRYNLKSNKILIYFTRNYIRRYDFEWWFHIAPYVHVNEDGQVLERVMDIKYTSGPLKFRTWSKIFLHDDAVCPVITKYSDYADFPYVGSCFIQRTNMYTYQPADLQMNEAFGYKKTTWLASEVNGAYLEAFDEQVDVTPELAGEH